MAVETGRRSSPELHTDANRHTVEIWLRAYFERSSVSRLVFGYSPTVGKHTKGGSDQMGRVIERADIRVALDALKAWSFNHWLVISLRYAHRVSIDGIAKLQGHDFYVIRTRRNEAVDFLIDQLWE